MKTVFQFIVVLCTLVLVNNVTRAEDLTPAAQKKVDAILKEVQQWASDPVIVNAVKAQNANLPEAIATTTPEKWDSLTVLDPFVRSLSKNEVGIFLKSKMTESLTLALVNDASGHKVAFVTKPKNWLHKGLPQHEQPMTGKPFQGQVQVHPATGVLQLLLSTPVLDGDKPIGVVIVGVSASKLE